MECAVREAGRVDTINGLHLPSLAETANEMLARKGITHEKIRKHLA